ncbi:MAG: 4'-phosphopantetheinyl transferase superfamily protein, partial [Bacteroidota bacterium]
LGDYLNIRPPEITFLYGEHGKPEYVHPQNIQFNISHSQDILVLAFVKDHAIGIDIEKITKEVRVAEIAKNFFSPDEITALMSLPKRSRHKAFYRCWTRKEAFIKAKGSGLSFPLDAFTVSLDTDEDAQILKTDWKMSERLHWNLLSFKPYPGYLGAVSVNGSFESVKYLDWNALESTYRPG